MLHIHVVLVFNVSCCMFNLRCCMFYVFFLHVNFLLHVPHGWLHALNNAKKMKIFLPVSCLTSLLHVSSWLFHVWHEVLHVHVVLMFKLICCMFDLTCRMFPENCYKSWIKPKKLKFFHPFHVWCFCCMFDVSSYIFYVKCCLFM